jgi:hypothetical protein
MVHCLKSMASSTGKPVGAIRIFTTFGANCLDDIHGEISLMFPDVDPTSLPRLRFVQGRHRLLASLIDDFVHANVATTEDARTVLEKWIKFHSTNVGDKRSIAYAVNGYLNFSKSPQGANSKNFHGIVKDLVGMALYVSLLGMPYTFTGRDCLTMVDFSIAQVAYDADDEKSRYVFLFLFVFLSLQS